MSQIEISCIGSDAVFTNTPNIFSGGNVDSVKFKFDSDWSEFTGKTAVFYTNPKETSLQILDSNNVAKIPANMIANKGKLSIGVIGTNANDEIKTSKILTYIINQGSVTDDLETTSITPNIWLQILSMNEKNNDLVQQNNDLVQQNNDLVQQTKSLVENMQLIVDESQMANKANKDMSNVSVDSLSSKGLARFKVGSYEGTGTYGSSNPNTLTFDFQPKVIIFNDALHAANAVMPILHNGMSSFQIYFENLNTKHWFITWGEKSVSWYCDGVAEYQYNRSDTTYYYIAIG